MKRPCLLLLLGGLLLFGLAPIATADTINFDSVDTSAPPYSVSGAPVTDYLAQYGVTLVNNTPGSTISIFCANAAYNSGGCASGTGLMGAPTPPNVLLQGGDNSGESFTLDFSSPLSTLSFDITGFITSTVGAWSATAYDASNNVLSSVSQGLAVDYPSAPPQSFTLNGPGITSVTFYNDDYNFAGFPGPGIDDLSSPDLHASVVPEPGTLLMLGTGLLGGLGAIRRKWLS